MTFNRLAMWISFGIVCYIKVCVIRCYMMSRQAHHVTRDNRLMTTIDIYLLQLILSCSEVICVCSGRGLSLFHVKFKVRKLFPIHY